MNRSPFLFLERKKNKMQRNKFETNKTTTSMYFHLSFNKYACVYI